MTGGRSKLPVDLPGPRRRELRHRVPARIDWTARQRPAPEQPLREVQGTRRIRHAPRGHGGVELDGGRSPILVVGGERDIGRGARPSVRALHLDLRGRQTDNCKLKKAKPLSDRFKAEFPGTGTIRILNREGGLAATLVVEDPTVLWFVGRAQLMGRPQAENAPLVHVRHYFDFIEEPNRHPTLVKNSGEGGGPVFCLRRLPPTEGRSRWSQRWAAAALAAVVFLVGLLLWDTQVIGLEAPPGHYPWAVRLERLKATEPCVASESTISYGSLECGASLIGARHVITAKHCFMEAGERYRLMIGAQDFPRGETRCAVACYDEPHGADVRLIDLGIPVRELPSPRVPQGWKPSPQDDLHVVGWGRSFVNGLFVAKTKTLMRSRSIRSTDPRRCAYFQWPDPTLCAEGEGPGPHDSGGPLTVEKDGERTLAGVFARSDSEVLVATDLSSLDPWINSILGRPTTSRPESCRADDRGLK